MSAVARLPRPRSILLGDQQVDTSIVGRPTYFLGTSTSKRNTKRSDGLSPRRPVVTENVKDEEIRINLVSRSVF